MGAGIVWSKSSCRVAQSASVVAQAELHNPGSCAICQKQLRKQSCAILRVAQAELRNPGSCASGVTQSWELRMQAKFRNPSCAMLRNPTKELPNPSCAVQ